jgi:predicted TIM-barrel fold metal-dependent hydrolase
MSALHRALHIKRVVIVTPSVYGTDNSATLYGMKARGATARGVAVIDDKTDLDQLAEFGIRGIRLNLVTGVETDPTAARRQISAAINRIRPHNWHLQIYTNAPLISAIKDLVLDSPIPVVFDHFGGAQASLGLNQPGFEGLIDLLHSAKAYVKISGAYRASTNYADLVPIAKALIAANSDRILWGTDWPHPNTPQIIDDTRLLNQLPIWSPDPEVRKKILVTNPGRLYNF